MVENRVTVSYGNDVRSVGVVEGSSLGDAIIATGLSLEQPCAGRGTCLKCKVMAEGALTPLDEHELAGLSSAEIGRAIGMTSSGVRAKLTPVSAALIDEVTSRIPNPNVPTWHNPDTGRDDPNPLHPDYVAALGEANRRRGMAALDAIIMFGVGLVEPVPDTGWEKKLKRLGVEVNVSDPDEREWSYKKYVAVGAADLNRLMALSGVSQEAVARAADSFPGVS